MNTVFDRIVIWVTDLPSAMAEYGAFFGRDFTIVPGSDDVTERAWLALDNTVLELQSRPQEPPGIQGLVIAMLDAGKEDREVTNSRQLAISTCDGSVSTRFRKETAGDTSGAETKGSVSKVDHLVLRTADADACIALFRDSLGIRLALDKTVPQWGGRMLFFRAGKMTLEVIEAQDDVPASDYFWGLAFQCDDIDEATQHLAGRGVQLSEIRDGRKPGTRVVTPKTHVLGVPTLLLEPASTT